MVQVGIAVGVGVGTFLLLCCLCWAACKIRKCIKTGRMLEEILVEKRKGVRQDVVRTFPIVETSELNFEANSQLHCPICLHQLCDEDTICQLPHCDHVVHLHCVDRLLQHQLTCPVCSTIVTDNRKLSEDILNGKHATSGPPPPFQQQIPLRSLYSLDKTSPTEPPVSSWMLVNRPQPLPRTGIDRFGSSDRFEIELNKSYVFENAGESPLMSKFLNGVEDWQSDDLEHDQHCIDISFTFGAEIPVEKRQPGNLNEKNVDSFTFKPPSVGDPAEFRSSSRHSRGKESTSFSDVSTKFSQDSSRSSSADSRFDTSERWDSAREHLHEVAERDGRNRLPLDGPAQSMRL